MAIEQTLFSIQRSVLQPEAVPALFSQYQWLLSDLFYNSDCTSCRNVNSALPLGIQFQDNISFLYRNSGMNPLQMEQLRFNDIFIRLCCGLAETNKAYHHYRNAICDMTKTQFIQTVKTN